MLKKIVIENYLTESNTSHKFFLSYELFGRIIGDAPLIIIVHALTGNSNVAGKDGWWNRVVGNNLGIDLKKFSVLAFNIPGNGYDGVYIKNYRDFITKDIAKLLKIDYWTTIVVYKDNKELAREIGLYNKEGIYNLIKKSI